MERRTHIAIGEIPPKQAPKGVPNNTITLLNDPKELRKRITTSTGIIPAHPSILAHKQWAIRSLKLRNITLQLTHIDGVKVVGKDVNLIDLKVRNVNAIGTVDKQLLGGQVLNVASDFADPVGGAVHVSPLGPEELVAGLNGEDGGILGEGEVREGVVVGEEGGDVGFEGGDDGRVVVEGHHGGVAGVFGLGEVVACPAEEVEFSAMVVVLREGRGDEKSC